MAFGCGFVKYIFFMSEKICLSITVFQYLHTCVDIVVSTACYNCEVTGSSPGHVEFYFKLFQ